MNASEVIKFNRPLRKHQRDALDRFHGSTQMALFWEPGTGKTTSAIAWLRAKYNAAASIRPTLIISPVATLYNWLDEFKINAPEKVWAQVCVPYMRTKKTKYTRTEIAEIVSQQTGIVVLNPDNLDSKEVVAAFLKFAPEIVIVDEAHMFKNPRSKRFLALLSISDRAKERAILTGTPILNSYLDLWSQFRILDKGATLGSNFFVFRERYFRDENIGWRGKPKYFAHYVPKPGIDKEIAEKISTKASRLRKEDCLDLPELVYTTRHVEMSAEQRRAYDAMEKELLAEVREGTCVASNALSRVLRMLQILSGYIHVETKDSAKLELHFKENPRLSLLKELLEELTPNHKVIVWVVFKENYRAIRLLLEALNLKFAELTGDTVNRQEEIDTFQKDDTCRVMLSNPQAGGVGVNLTAASYSIYYSRSYSLGDRLQSESRNHRGGSEIHSKITIIDLVCRESLDEDVLSALLRKENFSDNVLEKLRGRYEPNC